MTRINMHTFFVLQLEELWWCGVCGWEFRAGFGKLLSAASINYKSKVVPILPRKVSSRVISGVSSVIYNIVADILRYNTTVPEMFNSLRSSCAYQVTCISSILRLAFSSRRCR